MNPYIYAGSDPVMNVDPDGLEFTSSLYKFAYNTSYAINDGLTFGLWTNFNNWYYGGTGFDPNSAGGYIGGAAAMAITGPSRHVTQGVATKVEPFAVGAYNEIRGTLKGYDAHHVGQAKIMESLIPGYNRNTAPAILVPKVGHTTSKPGVGIVTRNINLVNPTPRGVIARDIMELRRVYPDIPNGQLQFLINMNKVMYPTYFIK
ncbi:hypothetical protein [Acinetobacter dispersus]|uniref:hypothetical protein n=2 Tax=Acinetobacter dispersus TaxID=70348 RepID=UPI001BB160F7|nr:hypothetical protein [Acinetobacter dispersus]